MIFQMRERSKEPRAATRPPVFLLHPSEFGGMGKGSDAIRASLARLNLEAIILGLTTPGRGDDALGKLSWASIKHAALLLVRQAAAFARGSGALYIPIGQWGIAFVRDLALVASARLFRSSIVIHLHGSELPSRISRSIVLRIILSNQSWIVLSDEVAADINRSGIKYRCVHTIRNEVPSRRPTHNRIAEIGRPLRVGFLGAICRGKGADLVSALPKHASPEVEAILAGPLLDQSFSLDGALYLGALSQDELSRRFWPLVDLLLLPSRWREGLPFAILEALDRGVVVAATPSAGLAELLSVGAVEPVRSERHSLVSLAELLSSRDRYMAMLDAQQRAWSAIRGLYLEVTVQESLDKVMRCHFLVPPSTIV